MLVTGALDLIPSPEEVEDSEVFQRWLERFGPAWFIRRVHVHHAVVWGGEVRMVLATVNAIDPLGRGQKVVTLLRGRTVEILPVIVTPEGAEYVAFVEQSRPAAGQVCISLPAGMVDGETPESAALRELKEEIGGNLVLSRPVCLNRFIGGTDGPLLVSPGSTDELVSFYAVHLYATEPQARAMHGSIGGVPAEGEQTKVHVVPRPKARAFLGSRGYACLKSGTALLAYEAWRSEQHRFAI